MASLMRKKVGIQYSYWGDGEWGWCPQSMEFFCFQNYCSSTWRIYFYWMEANMSSHLKYTSPNTRWSSSKYPTNNTNSHTEYIFVLQCTTTTKTRWMNVKKRMKIIPFWCQDHDNPHHKNFSLQISSALLRYSSFPNISKFYTISPGGSEVCAVQCAPL